MNTGNRYDKNKKFSIRERLRSFANAFSGISVLLQYEHNARIHLFILILVLMAGVVLRISTSEWIAVTLSAGLVFTAECFNTALEYFSDIISPGFNENIGRAKDVAAAAVFIAAVVSVIIGLIIFLPAIYRLFVS
jgi:diacylglycerol kinase (ATP)